MSFTEEAKKVYSEHTGKQPPKGLLPYDPATMSDVNDAIFNGTYGMSWARGELDMRTKSFLCMAITATLGTELEFKRHVAAAHHLGVTKEEIVGMLVHFMSYLGAPRASVARKLAREAWEEMESNAKQDAS